MHPMNTLPDLIDALNDSASGEGCEADLIVVGASELAAVIAECRRLKRLQESREHQVQARDLADQQKLVRNLAALSIWSYDRDDGSAYEECEEPDDGYVDSHMCLMRFIEQARSTLPEHRSGGEDVTILGPHGFSGIAFNAL